MTVEKQVHIVNRAGIHCRPSASIIQTAAKYPQVKFSVKTPRGETDLRSLLSLLAMGLQQGEPVTVKASGAGEAEACEEIADLFAFSFDFPTQG